MKKQIILKKVGTLGVIGIMAIGQCFTTYAASTLSMEKPLVKLSGRTSGYSITATARLNSTQANRYLVISEMLRYKTSSGKTAYTKTYTSMSTAVTSSYTYGPIFSGSNIKESQFNRAIAYGYYRTSANGNNLGEVTAESKIN